MAPVKSKILLHYDPASATKAKVCQGICVKSQNDSFKFKMDILTASIRNRATYVL